MPQYTQKEGIIYSKFSETVRDILSKSNQSIATRIEQLAEKHPERKALFYEESSWTWQEFNEESNKIANFFRNLGLNPGDPVALMMENSPEYLFYTTGLTKLQGISALINFNQRKQALIHSFKIADPKWIIVDGDSLPHFNDIFKELALKNDQIFITNNLKNINHDFRDLLSEIKSVSITNPSTTHNSILRQTVFYIFTSGTTGLPKAVVMENFKLFTQGCILGIAFAQADIDDIIYIPAPLYHNLGIGVAWVTALLTGAAVALRKRFSASEFWKDIQKFKATFSIYVGEIPRYLLNIPPSEYERNHSLKKMLGLGLRKEIWNKFKSRFNIDHIYEFYGLTEGHRTLFNADEIPGMVGRLTQAGPFLAKVNPDTGEFLKNQRGFCVKCKPGDTGIALIKIDKGTFFTGYKNKEKTQKKLIYDVLRKNDTFFNTGDMLTLHDDYWVSFTDRLGDTYRWKGENISTLEVESILNSYQAINMSAVYGVLIPNTEGKGGMAAIKLNPLIRFDIDELSNFVIDVLPAYSRPVFIRIHDKFELAGPYKIKKTDFRSEAYDISRFTDQIFLWDVSAKKHVEFDELLYNKIKTGQLKI